MRTLFDTTEINGMTLSNRFVRSATWEGMATEDGAVTPKLIQTMENLANGNVGLIISGHSYVEPQGQAGPWQMGVYKDDLLAGLTEMTRAVHAAGGKIVMQLAHAGTFSSDKLTGCPALAVSADEDIPGETPRREIAKDDIDQLIDAFAKGAARAKEAGFDGVQIHSAHGYLLNQFLSPIFNRRQDEYGGSIENRARIHVQILKAIREAVGKDYPVMIKLNGSDYAEGGLGIDEAAAVGKMLADNGLDAVELSGGLVIGKKLSPSRSGINSPEKEAYFAGDAETFRKSVDLPLILVGGVRSMGIAEDIISKGTADYLAMCRPLIREPHLIKRWQEGDTRKANCKSDNLCFGPAMKGEGIYCVARHREAGKA